MNTLFATNRMMFQSDDRPVPHTSNNYPIDHVRFNLDDNVPSPCIHFCERVASDNYSILHHSDFLSRLKVANAKQILLYIHGFNNLPEDGVFTRVDAMQRLCHKLHPGLVLVVPLIWPCDNDTGVLKDYWDDQKAADASDTSFARMLEFFLGWRDQQADLEDPCFKRINIIAHSMGNRVLRGALIKTIRRTSAEGLFRNIFMVAADVTNECLERGQSGQIIPSACRNLTIYHANDDFALRASKVVNVKNAIVSRRLGHTGPERIEKTPSNVFVVDCDNFNNTLDHPKGHTYFMMGNRDQYSNVYPVMRHMIKAMRTGRVEVNSGLRSMMLPIDYGS